MICLALGLGILGFVAVRRARHFHHCYAYGGHHGGFGPPWSQWHGGHHGYSYGRRGLYMALSRLDCSPAQERAIIHEIDHLRSKLRDTRYGLKDSRGDLAAALRGRVDAATGEARTAILDAIRNTHAVLDDKQREQLATLIDEGWWRRGGGSPYRV